MLRAWLLALLRLAIALAIAVIAGLVTGRIALCLTIVLGGMLARQYANL